MAMRVPKSISAQVEEWELIETNARLANMNRSEFMVACVMSAIRSSQTYDSIGESLLHRLTDLESNIENMRAVLIGAKESANSYSVIEDQIQKKQQEETKEKERMLINVRTPSSRPPQDIEPQMYKPSLDEVLDYIKTQRKCTNLEIAEHFNAKPTYIKFVVPTDHPELTVRSSDGVMTYSTGDE